MPPQQEIRLLCSTSRQLRWHKLDSRAFFPCNLLVRGRSCPTRRGTHSFCRKASPDGAPHESPLSSLTRSARRAHGIAKVVGRIPDRTPATNPTTLTFTSAWIDGGQTSGSGRLQPHV